MTDPTRWQFLASVAVPALPAPDSEDDGAPTEEPPTDGDEEPLAGLFSSLHAEGTFDESLELDARAGERWTGQRWVPVVDLTVEFWLGDLTITLDEAAARALAAQLLDAFEES